MPLITKLALSPSLQFVEVASMRRAGPVGQFNGRFIHEHKWVQLDRDGSGAAVGFISVILTRDIRSRFLGGFFLRFGWLIFWILVVLELLKTIYSLMYVVVN